MISIIRLLALQNYYIYKFLVHKNHALIISIDASTEDSLPEYNHETMPNAPPIQEPVSGADEIKVLESSLESTTKFDASKYNDKA